MRAIVTTIIGGTVSSGVLFAGTVWAGSQSGWWWRLDPAMTCEVDKNRVAGNYALCRQLAEAKAVKKDETPDFKKCDAMLFRTWAGIEAKAAGACSDAVTAADVQWFVAQHTNTVAAAVNQGSLQAPAPIDLDSSTYEGISCYWFENQNGTQGSKLTGVQCVFTSSQDGTTNDPASPDDQHRIAGGHQSVVNGQCRGGSIQDSSLVAIEALGGKGRNGDSCDTCSSGKGGGGGYAISVQTLGDMQQMISENVDYVNETTTPLLFVYVGKEGKGPRDQKGGGGGAAFRVPRHAGLGVSRSAGVHFIG